MTKEQKKQLLDVSKDITGTENFDIFSDEEVNAIHQMSYRYKYGVFIRLALNTGISLGELLMLLWSDFGSDNTLCINKNLISLPMCLDNINIEKPTCLRIITLPMNILYELGQWRNAQYADIVKTSNVFDTFQYVVTDNIGHPITMDAFLREYFGILSVANVRTLPFSTLRNTFVYNSLKAGIDRNIVAQVIGVQVFQPLIAGEAIKQIPQMTNYVIPELNCSKSYPVIVTPENDDYYLTVVDFGDLSGNTKNIQEGLDLIVKGICEKKKQILLPEPTAPYMIDLHPEEYIAVVTINP